MFAIYAFFDTFSSLIVVFEREMMEVLKLENLQV